MNIPMPLPNTTSEVVARAASRCLQQACLRYYDAIPLGDVGTIVSGGTPSTSNPSYWGSDVSWITPRDLGKPRSICVGRGERSITQAGLASSSARLLPPGTVLLSSRAPIGHVAIAAQSLTTNQGFKNIICSERLLNRFLFHWLRSCIEELQGQGRGNTFLEIPTAAVAQVKIAVPPIGVQTAAAEFLDALYRRLAGEEIDLPNLPPPLEEQRRIVTRIDTAATSYRTIVDLHQEVRTELRELEHRILRAAYQRAVTVAGSTPLDSLLQDASYGTSAKCHTERSSTDVIVLRIPNVASERIALDKLKFADLSDRDMSRLQLEENDILLVRTNGSLDLVGRTAVVPALPEPMAFASYLIRLRLDNSRIDPQYAQRMLRFLRLDGQLFDFARTTAGQYNVSVGRLRAVEIPTPPLSEQQRLVQSVDTAISKVASASSLLGEIGVISDALFPGILDRAFKGEL